MVLRERIELSWACARAILNRVRLPIPPSERGTCNLNQLCARCKLKQTMRNYLASFVNLIHVGVVVLSLTGWSWWPQHALLWYVLFVAGIGLQWAVSGNRCILTDLEWWLKHNTRWVAGETEGFIAAWARRLGVAWPSRADRLVPWLGLGGCLFLGCRRLILF